MAQKIYRRGTSIAFAFHDTSWSTDECLYGSGYAAIMQDMNQEKFFLGLFCECGEGLEGMFIVAGRPMGIFMAWRAMKVLRFVNRLRFADEVPVTLNALCNILDEDRGRLTEALASDFNMTHKEFYVFMRQWRNTWLTVEELYKLGDRASH